MRVPKLSAKDLSDCGILAFNRHGKDRLRTKVELIPALAGRPWGEWTGLDGTAGPHMLTQGDIGRLLRPLAIRSKPLWPPGRCPGTKSRADIPVSNSRRHGPPIANQAPHRHRQANSGTCRGREPPHARHTFEVLPPETRPNEWVQPGRGSFEIAMPRLRGPMQVVRGDRRLLPDASY